jgi:hypothetical protein
MRSQFSERTRITHLFSPVNRKKLIKYQLPKPAITFFLVEPLRAIHVAKVRESDFTDTGPAGPASRHDRRPTRARGPPGRSPGGPRVPRQPQRANSPGSRLSGGRPAARPSQSPDARSSEPLALRTTRQFRSTQLLHQVFYGDVGGFVAHGVAISWIGTPLLLMIDTAVCRPS